jgi:hypothetical protein
MLSSRVVSRAKITTSAAAIRQGFAQIITDNAFNDARPYAEQPLLLRHINAGSRNRAQPPLAKGRSGEPK